MPYDPIKEALAESIRQGNANWTSQTTMTKEMAPFKIIVDLSDDMPIHLVCGSVTLKSSLDAADGMIEELRKAARMVRAATDPQPPDLKRVK